MSGHTKGPWEVQRFDGGHIDVVKAGTNWLVAGIGTLATEANAHLIAAAPELLEALKAVIANHCGNERTFCSTCSPARTAIAKAEGREA